MVCTRVPRPISRQQSGVDVPYQPAPLQSIVLVPPKMNCIMLLFKKGNVWAAATKECMSPPVTEEPPQRKNVRPAKCSSR